MKVINCIIWNSTWTILNQLLMCFECFQPLRRKRLSLWSPLWRNNSNLGVSRNYKILSFTTKLKDVMLYRWAAWYEHTAAGKKGIPTIVGKHFDHLLKTGVTLVNQGSSIRSAVKAATSTPQHFIQLLNALILPPKRLYTQDKTRHTSGKGYPWCLCVSSSIN